MDIRRIAFVVVIVGTAIFASPLLAQGPAEPLQDGRRTTTVVDLHDLDLNRIRDQRRLRHRVAMAIERVCGSYLGADEGEARQIAMCRRDALADLPTPVSTIMARGHAPGVMANAAG